MHTVVAGRADDAEGEDSYQWNNIRRISGHNRGPVNAGKSPTLPNS